MSTSTISPTTFPTSTTETASPRGIPLLTEVPKSIEALADYIYRHAPELTKKEQILLVEGGSQYGALNQFTQNLNEAFRLRGHATTQLNIYNNHTANQEIDGILKNFKPSMLFSFNAIHEALELSNRKTLGQHLKVPSLSWFADHPLIQWPRIVEVDYPEKINAHFAIEGFRNTQHRVVKNPLKSFNTTLPGVGFPSFKTQKPFKERTISLLVPCSFTPFKEKLESVKFPRFPAFEALCKEAIDYLIASPEHPADTFLLDGLERLGVDPKAVHPYQYPGLMAWINHSAEMYWREKFLRQAKNIPLTLCGNGWEKASFLSDKWTMLAPPETGTSVALYGDTQAVWHIFPMYPESGHDRIDNATANGANLITEPKHWLKGYYGRALQYMSQDLTLVEETLQGYLNAPLADRETQANYAQRFTLTNRTFFNSVIDIEGILECFALRQALSEYPKTL
ncbi:MAG: hypothetical protein HEQ32_01190 [Vampirovibrio sp.]